MNCENFIKFSDSLSVPMDFRRKRHSRRRLSRATSSSKENIQKRPVSKRCSGNSSLKFHCASNPGHPIFHLFLVIFAETLTRKNEPICFYDFELDVWNDKKKIDKNGFKVRCENVQWSNEVETSGCNENCELSVTKTCQSQFDGFCPTVRNCSVFIAS